MAHGWYNIYVMCGRYSLATDYDAINDRFMLRGGVQVPMQFRPRYNIAPTQEVLTIVNSTRAGNEPRMMKWGLIPSWARDASIGNQMINARAETISQRPAFRNAFRQRRCLVVADGYYEWRKEGKYKVPMRVILKTGEVFGFAGLWETWKSPVGTAIETCSIVTTIPNVLMEPIHNRMPVILPKEAESVWLDIAITDTAALQKLLVPYSAEGMEAYEVSTIVNSLTNDTPEALARIG